MFIEQPASAVRTPDGVLCAGIYFVLREEVTNIAPRGRRAKGNARRAKDNSEEQRA
jgi:hypothetical protein